MSLTTKISAFLSKRYLHLSSYFSFDLGYFLIKTGTLSGWERNIADAYDFIVILSYFSIKIQLNKHQKIFRILKKSFILVVWCNKIRNFNYQLNHSSSIAVKYIYNLFYFFPLGVIFFIMNLYMYMC